ncbi:MAG: metallophosphoesterase, partial [Candidatus Paceibacterota bacterium]
MQAKILIIVNKYQTMCKFKCFYFCLSFTSILIISGTNHIAGQFPDYPEIKIIIFSDPHYFDASLGNEGKAFQDYLDKDRKLLRDSRELMEVVISSIEKIDADLVLVPGDLTKDGEKINHEKMAGFLTRIENSGKKVF